MEACSYHLARCFDEHARLRPDHPFDNRSAWRTIFDPKVTSNLCSAPLVVLPSMISVYLSAMDGTGQVERDLGALSNILAKHSGPGDLDGDMVPWCVEVYLDGPAQEADLAVRPPGQHSGDVQESELALQATQFTEECARLWLQHHGRRFRLYRTKPRPPGSAK